MAVAFYWPTDKDLDDVSGLQKSIAYDIRKERLTFVFKADRQFLNAINKGYPVNYALLILPVGVTADSFATLRQAKAAGVKVLPLGSETMMRQWYR